MTDRRRMEEIKEPVKENKDRKRKKDKKHIKKKK